MVSSDLVFTIAMFVFLVVLAAVVFRFIWLRRVNTNAHLSSDDTRLRSAPDVSPVSGSPDRERNSPNSWRFVDYSLTRKLPAQRLHWRAR